MAAGLGFKDFTTGEVLTAADVDGYLMQGVWVFADAAARDAAVTSPQEGNFAYLKDTNVTTYYTGSTWANLDTTGMTNPMTTTGDVIYSSSGSTPARLGLGTAGQVLQVNSGATAPEWAAPTGALTLVQRSSFSNVANTSTTFDGVFTSTYKAYLIVIENILAVTAADDLHFQFRYAGPTTQTSYHGNSLQLKYDSTTTTNLNYNAATQITLNLRTGSSAEPGAGQYFIENAYGSTMHANINGAFMDPSNGESSWTNATTTGTTRIYTGFILKSSSTNITGTVAVYGLA